MNVEKRIFEKIIEIFKTILFFEDKMVFYCKTEGVNGRTCDINGNRLSNFDTKHIQIWVCFFLFCDTMLLWWYVHRYNSKKIGNHYERPVRQRN